MNFEKFKRVKLLAAALSVTMLLGFTGCSNGTEDESSSESSETSDVEANIAVHKVGYIFRESVSGGGFAAQMCEQRERASNRSSVETCYIDKVTLSDLEGAVKALSEAGCTDIVTCSATYANIATTVAKKYLDLNFICYGALYDGLNISAYSEAMYQGAYVGGLVAEFNSKAKKIGVVVDTALPNAVAVANAVKLGSDLNQDGGAEVFAASAEKDNEIEKAIDALLENRCDVIVCYTNSPHSADYCERKGVKFVGCLDHSSEENKYSNMLMYYYARRDSYFLAQFKSMKMDTLENTEYIGDMSNGIIKVSQAQDVALDGTQKLIDALVPFLTNGKAVVFKGPLKDTQGNVKYLEADRMTDLEIAEMDWYVQGVKAAGNFREPQTNIENNQFEIKS